MAQIRGTGYGLGGQNTFGGPSRNEVEKDPSPLDAIREQTSKIEDALDTLSDPLKPYVSDFSFQIANMPRPCQLLHHRSADLDANTAFLQILTSNRPFPDCGNLFGRRAANYYTME